MSKSKFFISKKKSIFGSNFIIKVMARTKSSKQIVEKVQSEEIRKRARVVGVVITSCPECNNPVNFDRKNVKTCPYCEAEVQIDLDKIEVMVRTIGERKNGKNED